MTVDEPLGNPNEADFDLRQRYGLLDEILTALVADRGGAPLRILDVGSGRDRFIERFVGAPIEVTRADAVDIEEGVVPLEPGQPLPFVDGEFDVVAAMDVLEHVPADQRGLFLDECARVAGVAVVIACPCDQPATHAAEARVLRLAHELLGPHRMLEEHEQNGLPDRDQTAARLAARCGQVAQVDNVPLGLWEAYTTVDLIAYADEETLLATTVLHELQNALALGPVSTTIPSYRTFFVGLKDSPGPAVRRLTEPASAAASLAPVADPTPGSGVDVVAPLVEIAVQLTAALAAARTAARESEDQRGYWQREASTWLEDFDRLSMGVARASGPGSELDRRALVDVLRERLPTAVQLEQAQRDLAVLRERIGELETMLVTGDGRSIGGRAAVRSVAGAVRRRARGTARRVVDKTAGRLGRGDRREPAPETVAPDDLPKPPGARSWEFDLGNHRLPWVHPVNHRVAPELSDTPTLNVLLPGMRMRDMSGGPNTAVQLAYRLAADGTRVRFVSTDVELDDEISSLWAHISAITGLPPRLPGVEIVSAADRTKPLEIGENDTFLATAWWTAQIAKSLVRHVRPQRFLYLIQDYEPLFYPASTSYALAAETYTFDFYPIVNSQLLLDHLRSIGAGRFADPAFADAAAVVEPAVDSDYFHFGARQARDRRRLLFYSRPKHGFRNMFELGIAALQLAHQRGVFDRDQWEMVGIGEQFVEEHIGDEVVLRPHTWLDFDGYADLLRNSDVMLSLMLSPHPSYPPLEMAACGGAVVTNTYGVKTAERLHALSENLLAAEATVEAIADALAVAVERANDPTARRRASALTLPKTWDEALDAVVPKVRAALDTIEQLTPPIEAITEHAPRGPYEKHRVDRIHTRKALYATDVEPGLLSFMTPVWNTDAQLLRTLARSVFEQDAGTPFEWVIVDNGSDRPETLEALESLRAHPCVTFERSDTNLGIIGGMRACLERARGRYVLALDHDDYLAPDAARVVAWHLREFGYPALFYSDEDKIRRDLFEEPFHKPGWDPILFSNSCYIAHLSGIRRALALELGAYEDSDTEASPDWDLFTRATIAGHEPLHVPEVLYSWRIHDQSTAAGGTAKPYVARSQQAVLAKLIAASASPSHFELVSNPRSPGGADWWIRRRRVDEPAFVDIELSPSATAAALAAQVRATTVTPDALVHLTTATARPVDDEWRWEAVGLRERQPSIGVVGGRVSSGERVVSGPGYFGFGWGCASPEVGLPSDDFGHLVLGCKQRTVSSVPADHCVVDASVLLHALERMEHEEAPIAMLGAWLGASASLLGRRVVCSPHVAATTSHALEADATDADRRHFAVAHHDLMPDTRTMSPRVDLRPDRPWAPATDEDRARHLSTIRHDDTEARPSYHDWITEHVERRAGQQLTVAAPARLSIITPVYAGTDPGLLRELATALEHQTLAPHEWIIAGDGVVPGLQPVLDDLARRLPWCRSLPHDSKRGILATMRAALHDATGDYVVPIDGDDLVTPDALGVLASVIGDEPGTALLCSDEDVLSAGRLRDPYLRPDWDPALHIATSYLWHLIAFRRDLALDLDLYGDAALEWCHDWDTVDRFAAAGHQPKHVPEVLYHWRHHQSSSTNTANPESAQAGSVRHLLGRISGRSGQRHRYRVEEFPIDRGAVEIHLRRLPVDPVDAGLVVVTREHEPSPSFVRSLTRTNDHPFRVDTELRSPVTVARLRSAISELDVAYVVVASDDIDLRRPGWMWEAVKHFELVADTGIVCGRIVSPTGWLLDGASVVDPAGGAPVSPLAGRRPDDGGPFALLLKPHTIDAVQMQLLVADRPLLVELLATIDDDADIATIGAQLGAAAAHVGRRVVYSPLVEATSAVPVPMSTPVPSSTSTHGTAPYLAAAHRFEARF